MSGTRPRRILASLGIGAAGVFLLAPSALSRKMSPPSCPGGRFLVPSANGALVVGGVVSGPDVVILGDGPGARQVAIASGCNATGAIVRPTRSGTKVKADWSACGSDRKVHLKATVEPGCQTMQGTLRARKLPARNFVATLSTCGDGVVDAGGGEECDMGEPCADGPACDACRCVLTGATSTVPPTTSSTSTTSTTATTMPGCDPEGPHLVGITAAHDAVRAGATPTPIPPLPSLCYQASVATTAQGWADGCAFMHNPGRGNLGENIYAVTGDESATAAAQAVAAWACEAANYDYATNSCSLNGCPAAAGVCGHYTQLVWRSTENLGCGLTVCTSNSPFGPGFPTWTFVVCDYQPPGNFIGQRPY